MGRHRNALAEHDDFATYTPHKLELRHRRAPKAPLWARLCVAFGVIVLLMSGTAYAGTVILT